MERKEGQGLRPRRLQRVEVRAEEDYRTGREVGGKPGKDVHLEVWGAGLGQCRERSRVTSI